MSGNLYGKGIMTSVNSMSNGSLNPSTMSISTCSMDSIIPRNIQVISVELNKLIDTVEVDGNTTLVATVIPSDADNKTLTWKSSDEAKATVKDGVVTGVAVGEVTITVATIDGNKTDTCVVTITE